MAQCGQRWAACFHLVRFDCKSMRSQQIGDGVRDHGSKDSNNNAVLKVAIGGAVWPGSDGALQ